MGRTLRRANHRRAQRRHRRGDGARSCGEREGYRRGGRGRPRRAGILEPDHDGEKGRISRKNFGRAQGARGRAREDHRAGSRHAAQDGEPHPGRPPDRELRNYARLVKEFPFETRVGNSLVVREPVGVVGAITPWNYPLHQIALKVAPALAAGCTVVLKPSEVAPFNAFILAEAAQSAGLPSGVLNIVTGYGSAAGEALVKHPGVDMISFTGSTRAGKRISELAAQSVKRVALELGGKSASVILDDADLPPAVRSA